MASTACHENLHPFRLLIVWWRFARGENDCLGQRRFRVFNHTLHVAGKSAPSTMVLNLAPEQDGGSMTSNEFLTIVSLGSLPSRAIVSRPRSHKLSTSAHTFR